MSNLADERVSKWTEEEGQLVLILTNEDMFREDRTPEGLIVELRFVQKNLTEKHLETIRKLSEQVTKAPEKLLPTKLRDLTYTQFMSWIDETLDERIEHYFKSRVWPGLYQRDIE